MSTENTTNSSNEPVSSKEFSGYWIPRHNAKVMKEGIDNNSAPFLPDERGNIRAEPIYNMATGYCLPGGRLIPAQFAKQKNNFNSNVVSTRTTITSLDNSIKEGEKGLFYNFKDEQGEIHTSSLFFAEQTQNPDAFLEAAKEKIRPRDNLKDYSMVIASGKPVEYLGSYLAACRSGMNLSVSPEIAEQFKQNIMPHLNNDLKNISEKDKSIESVSNILYNADRRATEICKTLSSEQSQSAAPAKKKQEEMEMCF